MEGGVRQNRPELGGAWGDFKGKPATPAHEHDRGGRGTELMSFKGRDPAMPARVGQGGEHDRKRFFGPLFEGSEAAHGLGVLRECQ